VITAAIMEVRKVDAEFLPRRPAPDQLFNETDEQTNNHCEERNAFDKSGGQNHLNEDLAGHFWLTGNALHGASADAANTNRSSDSRKTSGKSAANSKAPVHRANGGNRVSSHGW
jgi:hypothetical protein